MADENLPTVPPPAESLSRSEAQSLAAQIDQAVSTGRIPETPRVDAYRDRLELAATRPQQVNRTPAAMPTPSQAQRDAARAATPAPTSTSSTPPQAQTARQRL